MPAQVTYIKRLIKSIDEEIADRQKVVDGARGLLNDEVEELNRLKMGRRVLAGEVSLGSSGGRPARKRGPALIQKRCSACGQAVRVSARKRICPNCGEKNTMRKSG